MREFAILFTENVLMQLQSILNPSHTSKIETPSSTAYKNLQALNQSNNKTNKPVYKANRPRFAFSIPGVLQFSVFFVFAISYYRNSTILGSKEYV